ncbi:hypothetical protein B0H14DRAFT_2658112 [Mycena olivaceomarginata]|nr:hypothetical protein B0H14DRAFT_2658112 [Mycena olivaceomarginata]
MKLDDPGCCPVALLSDKCRISPAGSAPHQALESRRLQPPVRYSGTLPEPNTRISQRDRRVHAESSWIPAAESSSSRTTPTSIDQLRVPVFGNTERESRRRPSITAALAHHATSIVPNYEEFPASSFVIEDLLAMDRHLIHYQELCAQDSTPTDTVSAVLDMLFKSYLMQPWCTGKRIISTSKIVATKKGMLRCRLDWPAIVQQLGAEFAFGDYRWQHTPEELGKIFPPTSPKSVKSAHERAQYLDRRGKEPWVASVRTPPSWLSDTHIDFSSVAQAIVHCDGEKLWLPRIRHSSRLEESLDALEGLEVMHVTEPCAFIVSPFCLHAVITFAGSTHTCVSFAHAAHWPVAREGLEFCKALVRNPMYPASSAVELVEKLVHETSIWEQAIGPDSVAAAYLAAWRVDIAPYRNQPAENDEYQ